MKLKILENLLLGKFLTASNEAVLALQRGLHLHFRFAEIKVPRRPAGAGNMKTFMLHFNG